MEQLLQEGLTALGLPTDAIPSLVRYAELLVEKNKVMNLTAITEPADIAALHFLDSAALLTLADFRGKTVADVGTGAGFPGLPLRIVEPSIRLTLLDAQNKRIEVLKEVCDDLALADVECVHQPLRWELCLRLLMLGGYFVAMKSVDAGAELDAAAHAIEVLGGAVERVADYDIPGTEVRHRAILIKKMRETGKKYPRPFAKIKKAPL